MFSTIQTKIEKELEKFLVVLDKEYSLGKISPLLFKSISDFALRTGKRVRPMLLVAGYSGFAKKEAKGLYTTALSLELLHDFLLVHDDIIDKSALRRGKPSMHEIFESSLKRYPARKFSGTDLAIVAGDVMYAMAIRSFLSINEPMERKEKALKKFIEGAIYTGCGEFVELMLGLKPIEKVQESDIYSVYDLKTAYYTFICPLSAGAILAGADEKEITMISGFGRCLGRAFQIKDDILGIFAEEKKTGKSSFTDLKERKKTLLVWHAYNNSAKKYRQSIKHIFNKKNPGMQDLVEMRKILNLAGSKEYAEKEIKNLLSEAKRIAAQTGMKPGHKEQLISYAENLLAINL